MPFSDADLAAIIAANPNKATATLAGSVSVQGIFTAPAKNIPMFDGSVNSLAPQFTTRQIDVTTNGIDIGSAITINGVAYTVIDTDERNDGMVGLPLTKESNDYQYS